MRYQIISKKNKIQHFQNIQNSYKFLVFCSYNDLTAKQFICLKIILKQNQINFFKIKNTLNPYKLQNFKNKNNLIIVFFNTIDNFNFFNNFLKTQHNLKLLICLFDNKLYTNYKLIQLKKTLPLPMQLNNNIINLYRILLQIN